MATFAQLLRECAPNIGQRTMTALVRVESDGYPYALHDNTIARSFHPVDAREATAWASQLIATHHNVDLGLSQINSANLGKLSMSVADAFDPCANLHGGATILSFDYRTAVSKFGAGQYALRRAIGAYNSGSIFEGDAYVSQILAAAGIAAVADFQVPDVEPLPGSRAAFVRRAGAMPPLPHLAISAPRPSATLAPVALQPASGLTPFNAPLLVTNGISSSPNTVATVEPHPSASPVAAPVLSAAFTPVRSGILVPVAAASIVVATPTPKP